MMNVLSITTAKSFIDAHLLVTIQLPSSVQYAWSHNIALTMVTGWLPKHVRINKRFGYCNRENIHLSAFGLSVS